MYKCGHSAKSAKKDCAEAVKWYRKAAEDGNTDGMDMLGDMYHYGEDAKQSYLEALKWYRKAAEKTFIRGSSGKLARLCFFGRQVANILPFCCKHGLPPRRNYRKSRNVVRFMLSN